LGLFIWNGVEGLLGILKRHQIELKDWLIDGQEECEKCELANCNSFGVKVIMAMPLGMTLTYDRDAHRGEGQ